MASTLSRVVHAHLAGMIKDFKLSWNLYSQALTSDFDDIQGGTTAEGIHAGVMAGTVLIALFSYAGINLKGEVLRINHNCLAIGEKSLLVSSLKKTFCFIARSTMKKSALNRWQKK